MKVAIIGSRGLTVEDFSPYLPPDTTELVSGGAKGIDQCVARYAQARGIPLTEFLPEYGRYRRGAPLKRNEQIVNYSDLVIAFWDRLTSLLHNLCKPECGDYDDDLLYE